MKANLKLIKSWFVRLCVLRNLRQSELISRLEEVIEHFLEEKDLEILIEAYNSFTYKFYTIQHYKSLKGYIENNLLYGENLITYYLEQEKLIPQTIKQSLEVELNLLEQISGINSRIFKQILLEHKDAVCMQGAIEGLLDWGNEEECCIEVLGREGWGDKAETLLEFYHQRGCGNFARYYAFKWDDSKGYKEIVGIKKPDSIGLNDLIGYELQKQDILKNTHAFLKGYPANNLLLYGARGTGKSSMVKAILIHFASTTKLRMIEIRKDQLMHLKELMGLIQNKPYYFIIFIDDLAFEDKEETYTALKTILEGGLEEKPKHMVIYATSNRRHLIQEQMSENELHGNDTVEEKLSLSDRFGMRIGFSSPNKKEYLDIVKGIVAQRNIQIDEQVLEREALKWEMWNNGKSGRTAKQFVNYIEGELESL